MKITKTEVFVLGDPDSEKLVDGSGVHGLAFVRIHTDEGLYGVGEGSLQYKDAALEAELLNFGTYLEGKDPFQIEHI